MCHDLIYMSRGSLRFLWGKQVWVGIEQKHRNSYGTLAVLQAKDDVKSRRKWRKADTIEIFWNYSEQDSSRDYMVTEVGIKKKNIRTFLFLCLQSFTQCLAYSKCSINIFRIDILSLCKGYVSQTDDQEKKKKKRSTENK